jgi:hypothetical protein
VAEGDTGMSAIVVAIHITAACFIVFTLAAR